MSIDRILLDGQQNRRLTLSHLTIPTPTSLQTISTPIPISTITSIPSMPDGAYCQPSLMPRSTAYATSSAYSTDLGSCTSGRRRNKLSRACTRMGGFGGEGWREMECCTDYGMTQVSPTILCPMQDCIIPSKRACRYPSVSGWRY
jgi:hypothetical protein